MTIRQIKIGTRGSRLALAQTNTIRELLEKNNQAIDFELVIVKTRGDTDTTSSLEKLGGNGLFTKQIEEELLKGTIDIAVHSAKDLPATDTDGLTLAATPPRETCEDAWLSRKGDKLAEIAPGSVVGTGSPRRQALLLNLRPDLKVTDIRGNVNTRLRKLQDGRYDALIMARAGLRRLHLEAKVTEVLSPKIFIPAAGQGFLAVQIRSNDRSTADIVATIDDQISHRCLDIERLVLRKLNAGCSTAVGVWAHNINDQIIIDAAVLDAQGKTRLETSNSITVDQLDHILIDQVIKHLISQGAKELIDSYNE